MNEVTGSGIASDPWQLQTPPLSSDFTMHRDVRDGLSYRIRLKLK